MLSRSLYESFRRHHRVKETMGRSHSKLSSFKKELHLVKALAKRRIFPFLQRKPIDNSGVLREIMSLTFARKEQTCSSSIGASSIITIDTVLSSKQHRLPPPRCSYVRNEVTRGREGKEINCLHVAASSRNHGKQQSTEVQTAKQNNNFVHTV